MTDLRNQFEASLPGWLYLTSGLALIAMCMLTPAWLTCRQLGWQWEVMEHQNRRLTEQQKRFEQFHQALVTDDPIILERLAFTQLRLKPKGHKLLGHPEFVSASVEHWLQKPLPQIGHQLPPQPQTNSMLIRLTTGPSRLALIVLAGICIGAGLWPMRPDPEVTPQLGNFKTTVSY